MSYDAVIVGSGPNGLAAAIALAEQGLSVHVIEAADTVGGGTRTKELTLPGFQHDICSAIHPMAAASPFLASLPLDKFGLEWIEPEIALAHPLDDRPAAAIYKSIDKTIENLEEDGSNYRALFEPFLERWDELAPQILAPFKLLPSSPLLMARFGMKALQPATRLATNTFETVRGRALFGGLAAHSTLPLENLTTSAIGMVLGIAGHVVNWPYPRGGSHAITKSMAAYFESLGGTITTGRKITALSELPRSHIAMLNLTPRQIMDLCNTNLTPEYMRKLNKFEYGVGVFKMDIALSEPIPWNDPACRKAGTVHLGGTLEEIAVSEKASNEGNHPEKPYVLVAQQSLKDDSRAPEGKHTLWAYCHVPNGSTRDMSEPILNQIERFAPGFRDCILEAHTMNTQAMHAYNPNYFGGDINGGRQDITQLFSRPANMFDPYRIPETTMYICSSSTPPGGGVHGMCGYHAAWAALKDEFVWVG